MSTLKVDTLQNSVGENLVFGNKNLLINGGYNIWQRSTNATGKTTAGYHSADRWKTSINTLGTWTQSRSTDVPSAQGFGYSLKMDCTTADASPAAGDYLLFEQKIEGQNLQHLLKGDSSNAKKVTLSFWVKSNKTGTYIVELEDVDNSRHISQSYTISSASTWEKKELTFDGDTSGAFDNDNGESLKLNWWLASGSDHTSGTLATSWASRTAANVAVGQVNLADSTSNEFYITGCQLEVGSKATDFEFEPFSTTERKCLRYCWKPDINSSVDIIAVGRWISATQAIVYVQAPVRTRANFTISYNSLSNFGINTGGGTPLVTPTGLAIDQISNDYIALIVTYSSGGQTTGLGTTFYGSGSVEDLIYDSEL